MDFMNRGARTQTPAHPTEGAQGSAPQGKKGKKMQWTQAGYLGFLVAVVILISAVLFAVVLVDNNKNEGQYVDKNKFQAVFLNGGQVYFGKISDLNSKFMRVSNIYYLRVNQQVQPDANSQAANNDISLVKLGCELHGPQDDMVINQNQVIFWENLKDDGQVAKAVAEYVKQNPNGQKCQTGNGAGATNSTNVNGNTPTTNTTAPATNNTKPTTGTGTSTGNSTTGR